MARRSIQPDTAWDDALASVAYTADALELEVADGDQQLGGPLPKLRQVLQSWEALDQQRRESQRKLLRSHAVVRRRDAQLDLLATQLHNAALIAVNLDRAAPQFRRLFPEPISTTVKSALEAQLPAMRRLALVLAEAETAQPLRQQFAERLQQAIERGEASLELRRQAQAAVSAVAGRVQSWKDDANAALLAVEGALKSIAAERKLDAAWVDAFFPLPQRRKAAAPAEPAPAQ